MIRFRRFVAVTLLALFVLAQPASAHVAVRPAMAVAGATVDLTFHVPNERTDATTEVELYFPAEHPIAHATASAPSGWTSSVDEQVGAVSRVSWEGGRITGEGAADFTVTVAIPSDAPTLQFKVLQTYADGTVVRWIDDAPEGKPEPDHPAPVLMVTGAAPTTVAPTTTTVPRSTTSTTASVDEKEEGGSSLTAGRVIIAIGVALLVAVPLRALRLRSKRK